MIKQFVFGFFVIISQVLRAGSCDFKVTGDARNGLHFFAQTRMPGLSVKSALGQLQQLALDGGYEIGGELIQGDTGELTFLQTKNHPALVVWAKADGDGTVSLSLKLAHGQTAKPEGVESEFCNLLGKLKTGKEGEAVAAAARAKTGSGRVIEVKADELSAKIGAEVKSAFRPLSWKESLLGSGKTNRQGEYGEAFAPIRAKYTGRKYTIDGQIYTVSFNSITKEMEINFLVTVRRGLLGIKQDLRYNNLNYQITAILAKSEAPFFLTLSEGNWVKITGTVTQVGQDGLRLSDCRQAK